MTHDEKLEKKYWSKEAQISQLVSFLFIALE